MHAAIALQWYGNISPYVCVGSSTLLGGVATTQPTAGQTGPLGSTKSAVGEAHSQDERQPLQRDFIREQREVRELLQR